MLDEHLDFENIYLDSMVENVPHIVCKLSAFLFLVAAILKMSSVGQLTLYLKLVRRPITIDVQSFTLLSRSEWFMRLPAGIIVKWSEMRQISYTSNSTFHY